MKQLLLAMMMGCVVSGYGAPLNRKKANTQPEQAYVHELAWQKQNTRMAAKGTASMKRVIASTYFANGVLIDTNVHRYSHGRGSTHNTRVESYYDNYSMVGIGEQKNIQCDTSAGWYDYGNGLLWDGTSVYSYDAANNVTRHYYSSPYIMLQYEGVYNSNNMLTQVTISDTFGGTALMPKSRMYMIYDGNGRRVQDSTVNIANGNQTGKRVYTYDANGNMIKHESYTLMGGSTLQLFFQALYTYDNQDRVLTETTAYDFGNGLNNNSFDSFAYTGNAVHPIHHRTAVWVDTSGIWDDYEILDYTLNAQEQPDGYILYRHINQWDTIERDVYHYDANGLMTGTSGYLYAGNGQFNTTPYDRNTLYYEDYDPNSVTNIAATGRTFVLSPNPSSGQVHFEVAKGFNNMTVINSTGQIVITNENLTAGHNAIDISSLPAGNYIMLLHNLSENTVSNAKFVKQ